MDKGWVEECYSVPYGEAFELPKPVVNRLRTKSFSWFKQKFYWGKDYFNERRCENLDMVATYRPYHFNGEKFGLYIHGRYFAAFFLHILERTSLPYVEAQAFTLESVLSHGAFHYLVERYAGLHYPSYKREVYSSLWGTEECLEETLANVFLFQNHREWDEKRRHYLCDLFKHQRDGYAQAAEVAFLRTQDLSPYYKQLQELFGGQRHLSLEESICRNTPFELKHLPVYLANDCLVEAEFEEILEVLFPGYLEFES